MERRRGGRSSVTGGVRTSATRSACRTEPTTLTTAVSPYSTDEPGVLPNLDENYPRVCGVEVALGDGLGVLVIVVVALPHLEDAVARAKVEAIAGHEPGPDCNNRRPPMVRPL